MTQKTSLRYYVLSLSADAEEDKSIFVAAGTQRMIVIMSCGGGAWESQFRLGPVWPGPAACPVTAWLSSIPVLESWPTFVCWRTQFSSGAGASELVHGGPGLAWAGPGLCN